MRAKKKKKIIVVSMVKVHLCLYRIFAYVLVKNIYTQMLEGLTIRSYATCPF